MTRLLQRNASSLTAEIRTAESQVITGMSVQRPSDDPARAAQAVRLQGLIDDQSVYQDNIIQAQSLLGQADQALGDASDIMKRIQEISLSAANGSWSDTDRAVMAAEVETLREQLINVANTQVGDRYIFSGDAYDTEAFDETGVYTGGSDEPTMQISANQTESVGFVGEEVFQGDVDVFAVLEDLQTALEANDIETIQDSIGDVNEAFEQMVEWRAVAGHSYAVSDDAYDTSGNISALLQDELTQLVGIDETEVYTRLAELRTAYDAAMRVGATSVTGSLFSYM
ncbi:MAG: flagellar hook-associated protein 3 [Proteobacteria bacterium]|nr:flagellar hook-associated protein 3 [Pseudomonadota bacterium]MCP4921718.1 flagellar hook-associated protein 3 [Pseudomonadota bacterium]